MHSQVYHSHEIQAWEARWFQQENSSFGLMQQVAWSIAQRLNVVLSQKTIQYIAIWCGMGNNAGDGYCLAKYLQDFGYQVTVFAAEIGQSDDLHKAIRFAQIQNVNIQYGFEPQQQFDCHIDALFGIGLNRELDGAWQKIIEKLNTQSGFKVAIDVPSGLNANTGQPLPNAVKANLTYSVLGLKVGLFTGQGKEFSGKVELISAIPTDDQLQKIAELSPTLMQLPQRQAFGHKGSYGHVLVIGGRAEMGGAVMMAAESAFSAGAGKVTIVCDVKHHTAILARSPNIMVFDINVLSDAEIENTLHHVDAVSFGMGLGRDDWAQQQFLKWFPKIQQTTCLHSVLDADALWFLAEHSVKMSENTYLTPHPGEAARLLNCHVSEVERDRLTAIQKLQEKYAGQWVLKGAGSLILEDQLWICTAGNAGMGTGGMGDVLAGMIASLKVQLHEDIHLHQIVTLHARAGDYLAQQGQRGLQAHHMQKAVYYVVNHCSESFGET